MCKCELAIKSCRDEAKLHMKWIHENISFPFLLQIIYNHNMTMEESDVSFLLMLWLFFSRINHNSGKLLFNVSQRFELTRRISRALLAPMNALVRLSVRSFFRSPQTLVMTSLKSAWEHERNCYFMSRAINLSIKRATGWSQQRHVAHVASALSW